MMISVEPVVVRGPGEAHVAPGLFLELLFTAPWNRPNLRKDGRPFLLGVGTELITWAAWFSRQCGHGGRLRLDSSPDQVGWYSKRGMQHLDLEPIIYEGVTYTPMMLSAVAAAELLAEWEPD